MRPGGFSEGGEVRHLYGTALASIMALAMFFGGAWGYLELLKLPVPPGDPHALPAAGGSLLSNGSVLLALAVLACTGVLGGLLVALPRISPLASGLPGLLLIAWTVLFLMSVRWATAIIPLRSDSFGAGWEALLFNGVLGVAGLVMIVPMFIPSRWRSENRSENGSENPSRRPDRRPADRDGRPRPGRRATGPITGSVTGPRGPATGPFGPATGPFGPATGPFRPARQPATGPIDARTGPIRTSSPIRTTGPIRLRPPDER
jgi:hypothetical protein